MSFANLRNSRQIKEAKSFIKSSDSADHVSAASSSVTLELSTAEPVEFNSTHTALPYTLQVRRSAAHGRAIYAKGAYKAGAILLASKPHVSVLSIPYLDSYCSYCCGLAPPAGLKRCPRCRVVWYCDARCQNNDWSIHKHECSALQRWAGNIPSLALAIPSDAIRCLGRILWHQQKEGLDSAWSREFNMMQSHKSALPPSAFESHTHLAHSVVRYLGVASPLELEPFGLKSAGDLVDLISRFTINTFTLTTFSLTPIGVSICPTIAFTNHSCEPNAVIVFPRTSSHPQAEEPLMNLVAIKPIAVDEEIVISYIDVTLPREWRQKALKETYNFTCECSLCTHTPATDPRTSMWCPKSCGGTCPVPREENQITRCTKCKAPVSPSDTVLDALRIGQEVLDKATSLQYKDVDKAKRLTMNMIPILTGARLTPSCHPLLALIRLHQELLVASLAASLTQSVIDETIRIAAKYSAGISAILPAGHPVRGVALAELGKLLAVDELKPVSEPENDGGFPPSGVARLKLAYETLVRARHEVVVGFGTDNGGGVLGREIRETIVRLEKELGAWTQGIKNALEDAKAGRSASAKT